MMKVFGWTVTILCIIFFSVRLTQASSDEAHTIVSSGFVGGCLMLGIVCCFNKEKGE